MAREDGTAAADGQEGDADGGEGEEPVDILTLEHERVFSSDDEEEAAGQLHYLPVVSVVLGSHAGGPGTLSGVAVEGLGCVLEKGSCNPCP